MTILVANANGKVGEALVKALIAGGHKIRVGARNIAKAKAANPGVEVVHFDYEDIAGSAAALDGITTVFSAAVPWTLPHSEVSLVELAKSKGVKRFVKLSYLGAELNETAGHRIAEVAIENSGLEWTHIRPTFFDQNYLTLQRDAVIAGTLYEAAADGASSFIDTRDIAAVTVKALTENGHHGKAFGLTGPEALTRHQIAAKLSAAIGKPVTYVPVDDAALRTAMAGAPPALTELMSGLYAAVRAGYTAATTDTVEAVLGRKPISFDQFAKDHVALWR